ncbi:MAG TPA: PAS domain-containing sensor histidine kinase, partial [Methanoregula sp.]|nr:PAS domain-containing sensor histidine kinase [Methanoregula sp.]
MQWEQFFYATGIPALILAPDHTILSANPASCNLAAKTGPELRGRKCYEIFHGPCATQPPNGCPMERAL